MTRRLDQVIQALRTELQEYGALLDILNQKHQAILRGDAARCLELGMILDNQISFLGAARGVREGRVESLSRRCGYPAKTSLQSLLPALPESVRGLLSALVFEKNAVALRANRSLLHCHRLLASCIDSDRQSLPAACAEAAA
jgi:hypothetical protein